MACSRSAVPIRTRSFSSPTGYIMLATGKEERAAGVAHDVAVSIVGAKVAVHVARAAVGSPAGVGFPYLISQSTVPCVIAAPASAARPVTTPSLWAVTGFSIFMASRTTTRSPVATV